MNSNPEPEGYSYVNLALPMTLGSRRTVIVDDTRSVADFRAGPTPGELLSRGWSAGPAR